MPYQHTTSHGTSLTTPPMKIIHTSVLLPVLLGSCSLSHQGQPDVDARQFVDGQITTQLQRIALAQKNLQLASQTAPKKVSPTPKPSLPVTAPEASRLPDKLTQSVRGLSAIKSLGSPEPYTFVNVNARNLRLEAMLRTIVPPGWTTVISADLKRKFTSSLSLTASDQWPYVLDQLLQKNGWVALIEWQKKTVSVAYRTPDFSTAPLVVGKPVAQQPTQQINVKVPAVTALSPAAPRNPFSSSRGSEAKAVTTKPAPTKATPLPVIKAASITKIWRAEQGSTLEDTLNLWASEEKCSGGQNGTWSVMWLTKVKYRIDAPLMFSGTYKEALNGIFLLYNNASVPLYAGISTPQCLLKVDDKEIKQ